MEKSWQEWVNENIERECNPQELVTIMIGAGFPLSEIKIMMGAVFPENISSAHADDFNRELAIERLTKVGSESSTLQIARDSPEGILVIHDFITPHVCSMLTAYADTQTYTELGVVDFERSNEHQVESIKDERRITHHVEIDGKIGEVLNIFNDICCKIMAPFYNVDFEWYERPQLLRYPPGGRYNSHADADRWLEDTNEWVKAQDRDYSILLYLNDAFEGGEIHFANQDYTIKPKPGMLVTFPSDSRYMHGALPTTSGIRYVIVSWAAIMGSKRVRAQMPYASIYLRQKKTPF